MVLGYNIISKARLVKFLDARIRWFGFELDKKNKTLLCTCASDFVVKTANTDLYHRASLHIYMLSLCMPV